MSTAPKQHTTIITGDTQVASVTFQSTSDDGRWFRLLNSIVDSGTWARLTMSAKAVLVPLARHAAHDGTSLPSFSLLRAQSGLSKSALYEGLQNLAASGLIVRRANSAWELFPGRPFAAARAESRPVQLVQTPTTRTPASRGDPPPWGGRLSATAEWPEAESATADKSPPRRKAESATAEFSLARLNTNTKKTKPQTADAREAAAEKLYSLGGMRREEAVTLATIHPPDRIVDAIDSLAVVIEKKKLRSTRQKFIRWFLANGVDLFDEVEDRRRAANVARNTARLEAILQDKRGTRDAMARLQATFRTPRETVVDEAITPAEFAALDDEGVWALLQVREREVRELRAKR